MAVGTADVQVPARPVEPCLRRERHNVSHLPPQPWCEHCVRGRAPEGDHKRVSFERADKELPVIAFDFAFLKTSQGSERTSVADAYATQLVAVDVDSGMIRGSVEDQVRVLRLDVEARYGISLNAKMSLWPWIARHAGWLLTRCKIKGNGYAEHC